MKTPSKQTILTIVAILFGFVATFAAISFYKQSTQLQTLNNKIKSDLATSAQELALSKEAVKKYKNDIDKMSESSNQSSQELAKLKGAVSAFAIQASSCESVKKQLASNP